MSASWMSVDSGIAEVAGDFYAAQVAAMSMGQEDVAGISSGFRPIASIALMMSRASVS